MSLLVRWILAGAAGWAVFTILFRLIGQFLFPLDVIVLGIVFLLAPILVFFVTAPLLRLVGASSQQFPLAAAAIVSPGMVLDAFVVPNLRLVLPNIDPSLDGTFGGFLLLAYASILVASIFYREGAIADRS